MALLSHISVPSYDDTHRRQSIDPMIRAALISGRNTFAAVSANATTKRGWKILLLPLCLLLLNSARLSAQTEIVSIVNDYVAAYVNTAGNGGRFWISAGPRKGGQRYLFHSAKSNQVITSNIVFRIERGGVARYYTNNPPNFQFPRPVVGDTAAYYVPYNRITVTKDTIAMEYELGLYNVIVRFVLEPPKAPYDNGADILIECDYKAFEGAPGATLGILMMLDGDNGAAEGFDGGSGDQTSILTTVGYFDTEKTGYLFRPPFDSIPEFYHIGNFRYNSAYINKNRILPIHRLRGLSNGGAVLVPPHQFAVGNWEKGLYSTLAWDPYPVNRVGDVATALQWENLAGKGSIRTAFGTNNEGRNNIFHCRDRDFFADIRTTRLIEQKSDNGPYTHEEFAVEMWISNTGEYDLANAMIRLDTAIVSEPANTHRITLDPSSPQDQQVILLPSFTKKLVWKLKLNHGSNDTLARPRFLLKMAGDSVFRPFLDDCAPLITIRPFRPPPTDTLPPVIARIDAGRAATAYWELKVYDRHPGFNYDKGLDDITVVANDANNFRMIMTPNPFARCDTTETVDIRLEVVDTARAARIVLRARDCKGNISYDSALYSPRPDPFRPQVIERDSSGSWDPSAWPCNARVRRVTVADYQNQFFDRGDYGLGKIEVVSLNNFAEPVITNERGEVNGEIRDFDERASIELTVVDSLSDAHAEIRVVDYAGNDTTLYFSYCTIDDYLPPHITRTGGSATLWEITVTDSAGWDRGLLSVDILSAKNIRYIWPDGSRRDSLPAISKGAKLGRVGVELVNRCEPGELIVEVRDLQYQTEAEGHWARDTITYAGVPDTLAPNIVVTPGFNGTTYTFDVGIDDIHYPGGILFECDRGLESITVFNTANLRITSPLAYQNIHQARVAFEVIDTLAVDRIDTFCLTAVDSVGNTTTRCAYWPTSPDGKSPVFTGRFNRANGAIIGTAYDDRQNDRGLGSITIRSATNIAPSFAMTGLAGMAQSSVVIGTVDPNGPIAGEIVIRDLYGELLNTPESSIHTVVIPFALPVAEIGYRMPTIVDAGLDFEVPVYTRSTIDATTIQSVCMTLEGTGPAPFLYVQGSPLVRGAFTALPQPNGELKVRYEPALGETIAPGTLLGTLRFNARSTSTAVLPFHLRVVPGSAFTNDERETTIVIRKVPSDPLASELTLPAPLLKLSADSVTYINGECNRILSSGGAGKPSGLAILRIDPMPVAVDRGGVDVVVRDVPAGGATASWVSADGRLVAEVLLTSIDGVAVYTIPLPDGMTAGIYFLRLHGAGQVDSRSVMIVR